MIRNTATILATATCVAMSSQSLAYQETTRNKGPLPVGVILTSGDKHDGHHNSMHRDVQLGDLKISGGFAYATLPNAPVGGAFLIITNTGDTLDRLIATRSDAAEKMQIHESVIKNDIMRMRELAEGLAIGAGETVELKPGGYHLMLMGLKAPLVDGGRVGLTLTFETAGEVHVEVPVHKRHGGGHKHSNHGGS